MPGSGFLEQLNARPWPVTVPIRIIGGVLLFPRFGYVGVAAAIAVSGWVGAGLLGTLLFRRRWLRIDAAAWRRLPRICLATITMAAVVGYASIAFLLSYLRRHTTYAFIIYRLIVGAIVLGVAFYRV